MFRSSKLFPLYCGLLTLAKFTLVSNNEIVSQQNDPAVYAAQSLGPWSLGGVPPGYPMWLAFCQLFGIPQRCCIEALYLAAAWFASYSLGRLVGNTTSYVSFGVLAFAPFTYFQFNTGYSDGFYSCLTLLALGTSIRVLGNWGASVVLFWGACLGTVLGLMAITRREDPIIAIWILLIVIAAILIKRTTTTVSDQKYLRLPLLAGGATLLSAGLVVFVLCLVNYSIVGVFTRDLATMPGHTKLLHNLAQIETGQPQLRFVPISYRSRELAYKVSPAFVVLRSSIENPNDVWHAASRELGLPREEIGGGWIWLAINGQILSRAKNQPAVAERDYEKINAELEAAFNDRRLSRRYVIHPLIGGDLAGLIKQLPASISDVVQAATSIQPEPSDEAYDVGLFDHAFLRRASLVSGSEVNVQGWAFANRPGRKIKDVVISSKLDNHASISIQQRPDVVAGFFKQYGWSPDVSGFHAKIRSFSPDQIIISYLLDDGSAVVGEHLKNGIVSHLKSKKQDGPDVIQGIDIAGYPSSYTALNWMHRTQLVAARYFQSGIVRRIYWIVPLFAFIVASCASLWQQSARSQRYLVIIGLIFMLFSARILFYAVLNARAWNGAQIRYLTPAHALLLVLVITSFAVVVKLFFERRGLTESSVHSIRRSKSPEGTY